MNDVSLREYLEEKFKHQDGRIDGTNRRLDQLTDAIVKLTESTVTLKKFESTYHRVGELQQMLHDVDNRVDKVEGYIGTWRYIGAAVVTVIVAIVIAWLKGALGV